jgi:putative redox protein
MTAPLATAAVSSRLSNEPGRALLSARGHHLLTDAPPMLGGTNESANPVELLLASLAACGTFVFERAAQELGIALRGVAVTASGDFDPRGVCGEAVDPRFQAIRVRVALDGPDAGQKDLLLQAFRSRCPVYATLSRAVDLTLELA